MIEGIGLPEVGMGLGWIVAAVYTLGVLRGGLIPRSTHNDTIHDRDQWRAESRIKDAQLAEKDAQLSEKDVQLRHLGEVGRTVDAIMRSIQRVRAGSDEE